MDIEERKSPRPWQAAVLVISDRIFQGEAADESGPALIQRLTDAGYEVAEQLLLPQEADVLKRHLSRLADQRQLDLVFTAGGTGSTKGS